MSVRSSRRVVHLAFVVTLLVGIGTVGTGRVSASPGAAGPTWGPVTNGRLQRRSSHPKLAPSLDADSGSGGAARKRVDVDGADTAAIEAAIQAAGGQIYSAAPGSVRADVPVAALVPLANDPRVEHVHEPRTFRPDVTTQGIGQTGANVWQTNGRTGAGTKVAVVDLGFTGLATQQAAGNLPQTINRSFCGDGSAGSLDGDTNHGTGVAEIVHQMAPDAQMYLVCFDQDPDLSGVVSYLSSQGVTIVNASWGDPLLGRGDGSGGPDTAAGAIAAGRAAGQLWTVAAGNDGGRHYSFQGVDADNDGGVELFQTGLPVPGPDPQEIFNFTLQPGQTADIGLKWDAWPVTDQEFAICIWADVVSDSTAVECATSGQSQAPDIPAAEAVFSGLAGHSHYLMAILRVNATISPRMDLYFFGQEADLQAVNGGGISDPASSPAAFAVGAYNVNAPGSIEPFSSDGPTIDGRLKPDISGPDGVENDVVNPFFGTSASTPHVTGAAALVQGAFPGMTVDQIEGFLTCRAMDGGPGGPDNSFGFGRLNMGSLSPALPQTATLPALVRGTTVFERNDQCSGPAQEMLNYGAPGDQILMCDWDGNGTKTPGVFRNGFWLLRNAPGNGVQDVPTFQLGDPGDIPVCGHWSNATPGTADTAGVFRRGVFFLKFANTTGVADTSYGYGISSDTPVTGDWNADGITTAGVFRGGTWFLRNSNTTGVADQPPIGYGVAGDLPVVGDWDGNGTTTTGVFRGGLWLLRNDNSGGVSTLPTFLFGAPGDQPRGWR